jgi:predicted kinase
MKNTSSRTGQRIILPQRALIVLCGPAGAGKSTFAHTFVEQHKHQGYRTTSIVSSDYCRALLCDDETNQQVNRDTFDLFYYLINKRMFYGRLTIADSTALQKEARQRLLELAARHHYSTCLFVFNMTLETCMQYDQHQARGRIVGEKVIVYHLGLLQQALEAIPQEGWQQVHMLDEHHPFPDIIVSPQTNTNNVHTTPHSTQPAP